MPVRESMLVATLTRGPARLGARGMARMLEQQLINARTHSRGAPVAISARSLGGRPIFVRPGTGDWEMVHASLLYSPHLPPAGLAPVRRILDLGVNIGVTVADFAHRFPDARILGVELDPDNLALARLNTEPWRDRVELVQGAAWASDGSIEYGGDRGFEAFQVLPAMTERTAGTIRGVAQAFSLRTLAERLTGGSGELVDYVKMDIEGAERQILGDADAAAWAARVRAISVELHRPYTVAECVADLTRLGFRARPAAGGAPAVTGTRP